MTSLSQRLVHDPEGFNTATWPVRQTTLITPADEFFTRSHAPTPTIDPATFRLEIDGMVERPQRLTLAALAGLPRHEVDATLVCAGLRRDEFLALGPLPGELPWGPEPVSTGRWSGCRLGDVLRLAGVRTDASHVQFVGLDTVERHGQRFGFGGSIDVAKALEADVLLATTLNGELLEPDHGAPLRSIVPGWIGARSVKWLGRITLSDQPSTNYFQAKAYRFQRERNPADPHDVSAGTALSQVPLNAVILEPARDQLVGAGAVCVRGWAMGTGGSPLASVEVSANAGADWRAARITLPGSAWTWSLWEATVELPRGRHVLAVRASDRTGVTMPAAVGATWNVKGYANNVWHRVPVQAT
jgi:sulfite oxidase